MTAAPAKPKSLWSTVEPFVLGGASGMVATCVIQPMDMIKVEQEEKRREREKRHR